MHYKYMILKMQMQYCSNKYNTIVHSLCIGAFTCIYLLIFIIIVIIIISFLFITWAWAFFQPSLIRESILESSFHCRGLSFIIFLLYYHAPLGGTVQLRTRTPSAPVHRASQEMYEHSCVKYQQMFWLGAASHFPLLCISLTFWCAARTAKIRHLYLPML